MYHIKTRKLWERQCPFTKVRGKPGNFQHQFILKETFNMLSAGGASRQRGRQISRHRRTRWRMSAYLCTRPDPSLGAGSALYCSRCQPVTRKSSYSSLWYFYPVSWSHFVRTLLFVDFLCIFWTKLVTNRTKITLAIPPVESFLDKELVLKVSRLTSYFESVRINELC